MGKTIYKRTAITNPETGQTFVFDPGDEVPDELADRVTNDAVWEEPDEYQHVEPNPFGSANVGEQAPYRSTVADAPYASSANALRPLLPDTGPVTEAGSTELTGEPPPPELTGGSSGGDEGTGASSEDLDRMSRAQLEAEAARRGIDDPSSYGTKAELRSAIVSADEPGS